MNAVTIKPRFQKIPDLNREFLMNKYISYLNLVRSGFTQPQARRMVFKLDQGQFDKAKSCYLDL